MASSQPPTPSRPSRRHFQGQGRLPCRTSKAKAASPSADGAEAIAEAQTVKTTAKRRPSKVVNAVESVEISADGTQASADSAPERAKPKRRRTRSVASVSAGDDSEAQT
jgi:hypothetical protein